MLEVNERSAYELVPDTAASTPSASQMRVNEASTNPISRQKFTTLEEIYGWMRYLRSEQYQRNILDGPAASKCRWLHCSSKYPDYLSGFLWALSDDVENVAESIRLLEHTVQRQTRYSKHGKSFAPFCQVLRSSSDDSTSSSQYPMLVSVPFLDWTVLGPTPPLRFQVDRREGFQSTRSTSHVLRSVLQHFYRLEDTKDREASQVFAKHKPWSTNRELDLKVRQWYGHYPSGLNVDELWVLAVDAEHIVTFSSNQTWKSRWPPLQLTSRISDVSFRGIRNGYYSSDSTEEYTAATHIIASLSGAVGMMHRAFWPDMVLCLTDRYAGHLGHLQYRLHRSPSTKLVMDLIACQEELNIVIQITQQQLDLIAELQSKTAPIAPPVSSPIAYQTAPPTSRRVSNGEMGSHSFQTSNPVTRHRATYRQLTTSSVLDPTAQLLDNLSSELVDLRDLRDNTDRLVTRTIQLVNIRLEDHGKAILVFTVVTIVFLPLNFLSSFFGMNFPAIRDSQQSLSLFWIIAVCVTAGVLGASVFLAFSGGGLMEKFALWREARRERQLSAKTLLKQAMTGGAEQTFRVYGVDRDDRYS